MPIILTPNMSLPVPVVGQELGPQYATDINNCMSQLDGHNHTPGYGVQIPPTGLNINSDLTFINNRATNLKSAQFFVQGSPLTAVAPDLGAVYVSGVDLWYNDTNGNQVRLTAGGSVNSGSGSISGLVSPASASYSAGQSKFIWQSGVNTSAGMDGGPVTIRDNTANAFGITLQSPVALPNDYSLTLPSALPASTKFLRVDSSGNVSDNTDTDNLTIEVSSNLIQLKDGGTTQIKLAPRPFVSTPGAIGEVVVAASTGSFSTASTVPVNVTNQLVQLNTTGRPVMIMFQPVANNVVNAITSGSQGATIGIYINSVPTYEYDFGPNEEIPTTVMMVLDPSPAGLNQYNMVANAKNAGAGNSVGIGNAQLVVYEI